MTEPQTIPAWVVSLIGRLVLEAEAQRLSREQEPEPDGEG